jgi:hypothetical protein
MPPKTYLDLQEAPPGCPAKEREQVMTTEVRERIDAINNRIEADVLRQSSSSLIELIAKLGPVNACRLAKEAFLPRFLATGWLMRLAAAGYLHRDASTGNYATSCPLPFVD